MLLEAMSHKPCGAPSPKLLGQKARAVESNSNEHAGNPRIASWSLVQAARPHEQVCFCTGSSSTCLAINFLTPCFVYIMHTLKDVGDSFLVNPTGMGESIYIYVYSV